MSIMLSDINLSTVSFLGFRIDGFNLDWYLQFSGETSPLCFDSTLRGIKCV
jgi:hypothetical protein